MRLQKFLSAAGICSRRQGEKYIENGEVTINGQVVTRLGTQVDPKTDRVVFRGKPVRLAQKPVYILLHKPAGYVTSRHQKQEKTVLALVDVPQRLNPVGRLDKDSTGLLLLTNDGALHNRLTHPSYDHEKEYEGRVTAAVSREDLTRLRDGVFLDGKKTRPAKVARVSSRCFRITLQEGRNRQIRRMAGAIGHRVVALKRIRMASLDLGELPEGKWRHLTVAERKRLLKNENRGENGRKAGDSHNSDLGGD